MERREAAREAHKKASGVRHALAAAQGNPRWDEAEEAFRVGVWLGPSCRHEFGRPPGAGERTDNNALGNNEEADATGQDCGGEEE